MERVCGAFNFMSLFLKFLVPLLFSLSLFYWRTNLRSSAVSSSARSFFNPHPNCAAEYSNFPSPREFDLRSLFSRRPRFQSPPHLLASSWRSASDMASASAVSPQSVHDFTVKDARGNDINLGAYKGKVLLIVNVASQCGLTNSNYKELSQLYEKYKTKGLEILAFPCNQFGGQEPGSNEQIVEFACTRFKAEYPIFDKVDVNGEKAAPIYKYLKSSKGGLFGDSIKWNFSKFLVNQDGKVVDRYAPTTSPLSIEKDIKKLLGEA